MYVDVVYSDKPIFRGRHYTMLCTDEVSRRRKGYVLPSKAGALDAYKEYDALVKTQHGAAGGRVAFRAWEVSMDGQQRFAATTKVLRMDNGGEFTSREFMAFLAAEGTRPNFTSAYTPEHNGVAERTNRVVWDMCRIQ